MMLRSFFMTVAFLLWASIALMVLQLGLWFITKTGYPVLGMFVNALGGWVLFNGCLTYRAAMLYQEKFHGTE